MIKSLLSFILIGALFLAGTGNYDTNAKIKAVYIYNFTKYIEWPKEYREQIFVIGVLGESALFDELKTMDIEPSDVPNHTAFSKCMKKYDKFTKKG